MASDSTRPEAGTAAEGGSTKCQEKVVNTDVNEKLS